MQTIEMLKSLCQANGVSGAEENALAVAEQLCEGLGACHRTVHKSLVCQVMPPQQGRPHLLLDAHIDEIGLVVTYIEEGGFLRVGQAGGVDRRLVMGSPVVVHAKSGDIPGVVGSVPPHIQSGEKKNPQIDEIWIDTGLDEKEVREQIDLGDSISFVGPFTQLLGGLVSSKAFDDRCCCVAVIQAAQLIRDYWRENHLEPMGLTVLLSSQEETGGLGALTASFAIEPTQAIAVDVTFGSTPEIADKHVPLVGKGPAVGTGSILSRKMAKAIMAAAQEEGIGYQVEVLSGRGTGTNADSIVKTRAGGGERVRLDSAALHAHPHRGHRPQGRGKHRAAAGSLRKETRQIGGSEDGTEHKTGMARTALPDRRRIGGRGQGG